MGHGLVTDADLARARRDPAFRQQLVAESLELLISELNKLRDRATDSKRARQIRKAATSRCSLPSCCSNSAVPLLLPAVRTEASTPRVNDTDPAGQTCVFNQTPYNADFARSRPGAERTAARYFLGTACCPWKSLAAGSYDPASGVPAFE
jgi:hypothetical protein